MVLSLIRALSIVVEGIDVEFLGTIRSYHIPLVRLCWPLSMTCLLIVMMMFVWSRWDWQPWSHSFPMETRLVEESYGNMWSRRASCGIPGRLILAVWVEFIF